MDPCAAITTHTKIARLMCRLVVKRMRIHILRYRVRTRYYQSPSHRGSPKTRGEPTRAKHPPGGAIVYTDHAQNPSLRKSKRSRPQLAVAIHNGFSSGASSAPINVKGIQSPGVREYNNSAPRCFSIASSSLRDARSSVDGSFRPPGVRAQNLCAAERVLFGVLVRRFLKVNPSITPTLRSRNASVVSRATPESSRQRRRVFNRAA